MHFSCKYLKYSLTLVFEVIEFEDFLCFVNFLNHWPTKALHVSHILHCIWLFALLCYFVFIFSSFFFFNCLLKKLKRKKTPNTSSKYSLLKSCEMLKVLTCSFVKWLTIKCQSCCSLTNFLLTIFFSSTYELPVINLLFALKFCFCKKLPHFNEHAAAAIQVWFAANSPLFCADACWDSGECLGFQMIPANQSTDCSQISACCPSAGKTLWMIEGKNKKKNPKTWQTTDSAVLQWRQPSKVSGRVPGPLVMITDWLTRDEKVGQDEPITVVDPPGHLCYFKSQTR